MSNTKAVVEDEGKAEEPAPCPWRTGKKTVFRIGDRDIELLKVGLEQKRQLALLKNFIANNIKPVFDDLGPDVMQRFDKGDLVLDDLIKIVESVLDPDLYQSLGELLLMEKSEFVEQNFDIGWIVDAAETIHKYNYGVKRLLKGFFSQ